MSYNIYIAGSFSNEQEKKDIYSLINKVRKIHPNAELFIPMEHFVEGGNEKDDKGNYIMSNQEWGRRVYEMDINALNQANEVIAIYRGRISGTGTAFEIGYAVAKGIPVTVYVPDNVDITSCMVMNGATIVISNKINEQK